MLVLALLPALDTFEAASDLALRSALCVIEGPLLALRGWAESVAATDLTETLPPTPERHPDHVDALERLHFAGNNDWTEAAGKRDARRILSEMHARGAARPRRRARGQCSRAVMGRRAYRASAG